MSDLPIRQLVGYQPKAGDVVFIESEHAISPETADRITRYAEQQLPGVKVIVFGEGLHLSNPPDVLRVGDRVQFVMEKGGNRPSKLGARLRVSSIARQEDGTYILDTENAE